MPQALQFPYMFWAHHEGFLSPYCLSQSGMPVPETSFLAGLEIDVAHPCIEAKPAIEARLAELFDVAPERVLVTVGASSAMHFAALQWFRTGTRVAAEIPSYEPIRKLPTFFGAEPRPLERRMENGWQIEPEDLRIALEGGGGPGHAFVTNSHNPTGAMMDAERMRALAAETERAGGVLVSCEVYMEFVPNEERVHAFAVAPNTVTIGGLTKAYGLGALRVGWMILGEGLADQMMNVTDKSYLGYVDPPTPSLVAGLRALDHLPDLLQPVHRVASESRPVFERWLHETSCVAGTLGDHGIIAFPRVHGVDDTAALAAYLQAEHQVDVVPGEYFGKPGHIRVGFGVPVETLREGLTRLEQGILAFRAR